MSYRVKVDNHNHDTLTLTKVIHKNKDTDDYTELLNSLPQCIIDSLETDLIRKYLPEYYNEYKNDDTKQHDNTINIYHYKRECVYSKKEEQEEKEEDLNGYNTMELPSDIYSLLNGIINEGVYYAYMISHSVCGKKKDTSIGCSKNPFLSVISHNNQHFVTNLSSLNNNINNNQNDSSIKEDHILLYNSNNNELTGDYDDADEENSFNGYSIPVIIDKDTASAAPHWKLDIVLGPFIKRERAIECCFEWVSKTRGIASKREKAPFLAQQYNCKIYSSQVSINVPLDVFLFKMNAPFHYIQKCKIIQEKYKELIPNIKTVLMEIKT